MSNTIKLKRGSGSNPSASDLVVGELAIRTDTGKIFLKKDNGNVAEVSGGGGVSDGDKGDITVSNSGDTFTIDSGVIDNANIASNAAIAGSKISPDFGSQNITTTGQISGKDLILSDTTPVINLNDSTANPDYQINNTNGVFNIRDTTNSVDRLVVNTDGHVDIAGNLDVGAGLDVTGDLSITNNIPKISLIDTDNDDDFEIKNMNGVFTVRDATNNADRFTIASNGRATLANDAGVNGNLDVGAGLDVTGNITVTGTVDGVDIAARNTLFGGLTSSSGVLSNGVTATTQSASDNSTKVATTAYTDTAIANLIDSSPSTLNTLNELASALGDDPNFATTVTNSIATKLPLAGGTLTGNLTLSSTYPRINLTDTNNNSDFSVINNDGNFLIYDTTNSADRFSILANGTVRSHSNFDALGGLDVTGNITVTGTVDGRDVATDGTKLDGIESGATADQTATEILNLVKTVDGTGSGLYADISNQLVIKDTRNDGARVPNDYAAHRVTSEFTNQIINGWWSTLTVKGWANGYAPWQLVGKSDTTQNTNLYVRFGHGGNNTWSSLYNIWHTGNDGSGSGLDADTLDGVNGANYVRTDQNTTITSDLFVGGGAGALTVNAGSDIRFTNGDWTGNTSDPKINAHAGYLYIVGGSNGIIFRESATNRWQIEGSGHFRPETDSTYDIGTSSIRVRNGYFDTLYGDGSNITGVNATTLDSIDSGSFVRSDATDIVSGATKFTSTGLELSGHWYNKYYDAANAQNYIHFYPSSSSDRGTTASTTDIRAWTGSTFKVLQIKGNSNDITWGGSKLWTAANDGSGSTLDADTLDGVQGSSFLRSDQDDTINGVLTIGGSSVSGGEGGEIRLTHSPNSSLGGNEIVIDVVNENLRIFESGGNTRGFYINLSTASNSAAGKIFHDGNDGSGSGLDADTLDGIQASSFLRSDAEDTTTAPLSISAGTANSTNDASLYITATNNNDWGLKINKYSSNANEYGARIQVGSGANYALQITGDGSEVFRVKGDGTVYAEGNNVVFHTGNDGSGSGLDADKLDGVQASSFIRSDTDDAIAYNHQIRFYSNAAIPTTTAYEAALEVYQNQGAGNDAFMSFHVAGDYACYFGLDGGTNKLSVGGWSMGANSYAIYHEGNNPTFSQLGITASNINALGINATTLDSIDSGSFVRSDASDTLSGDYTFTGGADAISITSSDIGSSSSSNWTGDPGASRLKIQAHASRWYIVSNSNSDRIVQFRQNSSDRTWIANDGQIYHGSSGTGDKYWRQGNDGSGSGLDADTLDGQQQSYYWNQGSTGLQSDNRISTLSNFNNSVPSGFYQSSTASNMPGTSWHNMLNVRHSNTANDHGFQLSMSYYNQHLYSRTYSGGSGSNDGTFTPWAKQFSDRNDGSGSGLDADTLDGVQGSSYLRSDAADTGTTLTLTDALRTDRFEDQGGAFFWREGLTSGRHRHLNLADTTGDPASVSDSSNPTGISWGQRSDNNAYYMLGLKGSYNNGYSTHSRLTLAWHTGIEIGASATYGGVRFMGDTPFLNTTEIMQVNSSGGHVKVKNNLYANNGGLVWNQNNDGSGSGLDADTLDGTQANALIRGGAQSSVSGWHISAYRNGSGTSPHIYFSHSSGYGQHINTYNTSDSVYALEVHSNVKQLFVVYNSGRCIHGGNVLPGASNSYDLGSSGARWNNLYVNDMHFSNEGSQNSVDGSWGDWTLQEGENDIFMINNRSGKKFKIAMIPV